MKGRVHHFPKWLFEQQFSVVYTPSSRRFCVKLGKQTGFGNSIAAAAKNARGGLSYRERQLERLRKRSRSYKTLPDTPCLRKKRGKKQLGSLVAAVRYKL